MSQQEMTPRWTDREVLEQRRALARQWREPLDKVTTQEALRALNAAYGLKIRRGARLLPDGTLD